MFEIFKEPFMLIALSAALLTAIACAYLGVFMILKRIVFIGIALSQAAALGVAIGMFVGINPLISAFILTFTAIVIFWIPFSERNISRDSLLGFAYVFCAALAVILIAKNPLAEAKGLNLISGNLLYTNLTDLKILGSAVFFIVLMHIFFFKEFIFVSFDRETAYTTGIKANLFDFLLYLTIGIMISVSMRISGVVFVFSSLVIPALTGIFLMKTIKTIFVVSILTAVFSVIMGIGLSYIWDLPSGPAVTVMYGVMFIFLASIKSLFKKII